MTLGEQIKRRRLELDLTLEEVGNAIGVGKSTVRKWESGEIISMRVDKIASLSMILQMNPLDLLYHGIDIPKPSEQSFYFALDGLSTSSGRLRYLREDKELSKHDLAELIGVADEIIESIEWSNENITVEILARYSCYFGISVDWILGFPAGYGVAPILVQSKDFSYEEKEIINAYRNVNNSIKKAIKRILDLPNENTSQIVTLPFAARDDNGSASPKSIRVTKEADDALSELIENAPDPQDSNPGLD